jgi:peptide/nickel transport system substrate-binding protein
MKKISIIILIVINIFALVSCSNKETDSNEQIVGSVTTTEISIPILKYRTLNPLISKDEDVYFIDKLIYDSLIDLDKNLLPVPELAKSWFYDTNRKILTLTLNKEVYWHDGVPLSAEDVKFTIDSLINTQTTGISLYAKNVANIKSVSINGFDKVILEYKAGTNNSIELLNFPIIPKHQFQNYKNGLQSPKDFTPIGTGAYKYMESKISNSILLEPNENYYQGNKAQNSLLFKIVPDKEAAVSLFEIGDLMLTFSRAIDREAIFNDRDINIFPYTSNEVELIGFNFNNKYLKDKKIRLGVANSIDTQKIIDEAYFGNGIRNDNIYFPNYLGKNTSDSLILNNVDNSIKLFNEAGFINRDEDIYIENGNGDELTINILVNGDNNSRIEAAKLIKNNLDKLPIHTDIIIKDWNEYQYLINSGNYDIYLGGFKISEQYDLSFALHSNVNHLGYSNKELDKYLELMQTPLTNEEKLNTFTSIKQILNDELPYYCLLYKTHAAITSKNFQGTVSPTFFNLYNQCYDWSYIN